MRRVVDRFTIMGLVEPETRVLDFQEVMALLKMGDGTLRGLLESGEIRGYKVPNRKHGRWKISEVAIREYLRRCESSC